MKPGIWFKTAGEHEYTRWQSFQRYLADLADAFAGLWAVLKRNPFRKERYVLLRRSQEAEANYGLGFLFSTDAFSVEEAEEGATDET